ncbi:sperm-associated antigen 6 [Gouania willdenowi]|uniref:sperm-associated antigen 6 n=1 Tax=Gouania willdenowi TaxID=441366 RepID=UPI001055DAA1|nr:sperm-associated antigen 6 [Gouania willdenowi]
MSQRQIIQVFEQYQKSRMQFVQTVADLSNRPQNIDFLRNAGVISQLRPLMLDVVPSIPTHCTPWHWVVWLTTVVIWLRLW